MTLIKTTVAGLMVTAGLSFAQTNEPARAAAPAPAPKTWADSITLKGDLRYRYESINDDSKFDADKDNYTRQRDRIRARIGADAKLNDNLKAGIGLSTGGSDPISGNSTLTDGGAKKEMRLDYGFFDYSFFLDKPYEVHGIAGKMKNPFITFPDDLSWDGDLNPEGLAVKSEWGGDFATLIGNGGYFWIQERDSKDAAMLYAGQGAVKMKFLPEVVLTIGAAINAFQNMRGYDVLDWEGKNNGYGNSTVNGTVAAGVTNKAWASEFTPVTAFAQLDLRLLGQPLSFFVQELNNIDADTSLDRGSLYGVTFGKAKNPKTYELGYSYAKLEKDATPGLWTDSDRWGGGTDGQGHKVFGKFQFFKNLQGAVTYFMDDKKISDPAEADYNRLQVDLTASF
jgi:hypothetical protein